MGARSLPPAPPPSIAQPRTVDMAAPVPTLHVPPGAAAVGGLTGRSATTSIKPLRPTSTGAAALSLPALPGTGPAAQHQYGARHPLAANPLSQALARPRKAVSPGERGLTATRVTAADGSAIQPHQLPLLRLDDEDEVARGVHVEVDEVAALTHEVAATGASSTRLAGVHRMLHRRKERHDAAIAHFEQYRTCLYGALEERAVEAGRAVRDGLVEVESRLDALFARAADPAVAAAADDAWLREQRAAVTACERDRTARVDLFEAALEGVETDRQRGVGDELQALTAVLMDTAHDLPPTIHRLVDAYASEVNVLVASNRAEAVKVVSALRRRCLVAAAATEERWQGALRQWRTWRHQRALAAFTAMCSGPEFVNPPGRVEALARVASEVTRCHQESLLPVVEAVVALRPPALTATRVTQLRDELQRVTDEMQGLVDGGMAAAQQAQVDVMGRGQQLLNALRHELHTYQALAPSGQLDVGAAGVRAAMAEGDAAGGAVWLRAPVLLHELEGICALAASRDVVSNATVTQLQGRVALLMDCARVASVLEGVGKAGERTALMAAVDALRTCRRADMPSLLVRLHRLTTSLHRTPGLPPSVVMELEQVGDQLMGVVEGVHEAMTSAGVAVPQALHKFLFPDAFTSGASSHGGGGGGGGGDGASHHGNSQGGGGGGEPGRGHHPPRLVSRSSFRSPHASGRLPSPSAASKTRGRGGAGDGASYAGSRHSADTRHTGGGVSHAGSAAHSDYGSGGDAMSTVLGAVLPLPTIRGLQKRLTLVACASDLPTALVTALATVHDGCALQLTANDAVDAVVEEECAPVLRLREKEGEAFLARVGQAYARQMTAVVMGCDSIGTMMAEVAEAVSNHAAAEADADEFIAEEVRGARDDFESLVQGLEAQFTAATAHLAHSPDLAALEQRNAHALSLLASLEEAYRAHHAILCDWARLHPQRVASVIRIHRAALCRIFGLEVDPSAATTEDGPPIEGEGEGRHDAPAVMWTRTGPMPKPIAPDATSPKATAVPATLDVGMDSAPSLPPAAASTGGVHASGMGVDGAKEAEVDTTRPPPGFALRRLCRIARTMADAPPTSSDGDGGDEAMEVVVVPGGVPVAKPTAATTVTTGGGGLTYSARLPADLIAAFLADGEGTLQAATAKARRHALVAQVARLVVEVEAARTAAQAAQAQAKAKAAAVVPGKKVKKGSKEEEAVQAAAEAEETAAAAGAAAAELEAQLLACQHELAGFDMAEASPRAAATVRAGAPALLAAFTAGVYAPDGVVPLHPTGEAAAPRITLPASTLSRAVADLRSTLLAAFHQYVAERRAVVAELMSSRLTAFTVELEDRLRLHGPRAGSLEVKVRAPRAEQLVAHAQRLDRAVRRLRDKGAASQAAFRSKFEEYEGLVTGRMEQVAALAQVLPPDGAPLTAPAMTQAQVQGLQARVKAVRAGFEAERRVFVDGWRREAAEVAAKLILEGEAYLQRCTLWQDGGEYDDDELTAAAAMIATATQGIRAIAMEEEGAIDRAVAESDAVLELADTVSARLVRVAEVIALRDGIGSKYGQPRRVALEQLRSASAASDAAASAIDARLGELASLLTDTPGHPPATPPPTGVNADEEALAIIRASKGVHEGGDMERPHGAGGGEGAGPAPWASSNAPGAAAGGAGRKGVAGGSAPPASTLGKGVPPPNHSMGKGGAPEPPAPISTTTPTTTAAAAAAAAAAMQADVALLREAGPAPLSVRLRRCVLCLRDALYARAIHLGALKTSPDLHGPLREFYLPFLSLADGSPHDSMPAAPASTVIAPISTGGAGAARGGEEAGTPPVRTCPSVTQPAAWAAPFPLPGQGGAMSLPSSPPAVHTIKGPSPGAAAVAGRSLVPYSALVDATLAECKASTLALFAGAGVSVRWEEEEDGMLAPLRAFVAQETRKGRDAREAALRQYRDQVTRLHTLLAEVGGVVVRDVLARQEANGMALLAANQRGLGRTLAELEAQRVKHASQLKLRLGDVNAAAELELLVKEEEQRVAAVVAALHAGRAEEVGRACAVITAAHAAVSHSVTVLLLAAEECVRVQDLGPLPGDEVVVPPKLSHTRMQKALRKSRIDGAAAVAAAIMGDVDGVELDDAGNVVVVHPAGPTPATPAGKVAPSTAAKPAPTQPTLSGSGADSSRSATSGKADKPGKPGGSGKVGGGDVGGSAPPPTSATRALKDVYAQRRWPTLPILSAVEGEEGKEGKEEGGGAGQETKGREGPALAGEVVTRLQSAPATNGGGRGGVECSYADWSRRAIHARDEQYQAFLHRLAAASNTHLATIAAALADVDTWRVLWARNVAAVCNRTGSLTTSTGGGADEVSKGAAAPAPAAPDAGIASTRSSPAGDTHRSAGSGPAGGTTDKKPAPSRRGAKAAASTAS